MVAIAEEYAVGTETRVHETGVFDEHVVQPDDLVKGELVLSGLQHGPSPSFEAVAGCTLAFDLEARAAIDQEQEAGGAGHQVAAGAAHGVACARSQIKGKRVLERCSPPDDRRVARGAEDCPERDVALRGAACL